MVNIGQYNELEIIKRVDFGLYLDGMAYGEILLPTRYIPEGAEVGDDIRVFIYNDSEDRLIATTETPKVQVGEFAHLQVTSTTDFGAFLDWGLPKDLLVPFREQVQPMRRGQHYLVYCYLDESTDRIVASARLNRFVENELSELEEGQEVRILIAQQTDLGYKCIVNEKAWGVLYQNEVFRELAIGAEMTAHVQKIREDGKIDLSLQKKGYRQVIPETSKTLLNRLEDHNGFLPLTDKSPPEEIYDQLSMSKKNFKKALGHLYKQKLVTIHDDGIRKVG